MQVRPKQENPLHIPQHVNSQRKIPYPTGSVSTRASEDNKENNAEDENSTDRGGR